MKLLSMARKLSVCDCRSFAAADIPVTEAVPGKERSISPKSDRSGYPPKQVMLKIHSTFPEKSARKEYAEKNLRNVRRNGASG